MNMLLVYPKCPDAYSRFSYALKFISEKASIPPLGLNTVAAMLPETWQKRLVDLNVTSLLTSDIQWADYIFISAMHIQKESVNKIIDECKKFNKKIIAAGMLFTYEYAHYLDVDHFILNNAEITLPLFLADLESGQPQIVYSTDDFTERSQAAVPNFHKVSAKNYAS